MAAFATIENCLNYSIITLKVAIMLTKLCYCFSVEPAYMSKYQSTLKGLMILHGYRVITDLENYFKTHVDYSNITLI